MNRIKNIIVIFVLAVNSVAFCQEQVPFDKVQSSLELKLQKSIEELNSLRNQIADEQVPLSRKLNNLENELSEVRQEYQQTTRLLDSRTLDLSNLRSEIKSRKEEATYLSNLLSEYIRNFESRLHIAEIQLYRDPLEKAKLAMDNSSLAQEDVYQAQTELISISLDRLFELLGGATFTGTAVDGSGLVKNGQFLMIGPSVIFKSDDNQVVGTVQQRLGSLEPTVMTFGNPLDSQAASNLIENSQGLFPLDPTLGNAHKIEETKETIIDHIKKGGPVMYPIFIMAGAALLVALYKWICMVITIRKPSKKKLQSLLDAIAKHDEQAAQQTVKQIPGPIGQMLKAAVEHMQEPRDLIEEVMYEKLLATRLKLERFLPFIAISAASAPLLGLLGTVTGIINTFKLITVFGSGDVKTLSGGISEALITTEFGLIVAIPSLLLHAFLSRKAKGAINEMEKAAVAFINQVSKSPYHKKEKDNTVSAEQIKELLKSINQHKSLNYESMPDVCSPDYAGGMMDTRVISVNETATVAETIEFIRSAEIPEEIDTVFVVDGTGKYIGSVLMHQLVMKPDHVQLKSFAVNNGHFVRVGTDREKVKTLFSNISSNIIPVLDEKGELVGRISRDQIGDKLTV